MIMIDKILDIMQLTIDSISYFGVGIVALLIYPIAVIKIMIR